MGAPKRYQAHDVRGISRVVSELGRSETFYRQALGFEVLSRRPPDRDLLSALGISAAEEVVLRLGDDVVSLVQCAEAGQPYPAGSRSSDLWFQHIAIVVSDIDVAYDHLARHSDWRPISQGGPQHLPPSSGGVWAFKFRDPDDHPLELICFPSGEGRAVWHRTMSRALFLGIDHSALSVSSADRSLDFYRSHGFKVTNRSLNRGAAQGRLDDLPHVQARVTALRPASAGGPGLELLAYDPPGRPLATTTANDLLTDWVTVAVNPSLGALPVVVRDPDGHRLVLVDQNGRDQGGGVSGVPA